MGTHEWSHDCRCDPSAEVAEGWTQLGLSFMCLLMASLGGGFGIVGLNTLVQDSRAKLHGPSVSQPEKSHSVTSSYSD